MMTERSRHKVHMLIESIEALLFRVYIKICAHITTPTQKVVFFRVTYPQAIEHVKLSHPSIAFSCMNDK